MLQDPNIFRKTRIIGYWVQEPVTQSNDGGAYQSSLWSQFGKVEYSYAGKYLINASLRRDGASVFAEDARWGTFPEFPRPGSFRRKIS